MPDKPISKGRIIAQTRLAERVAANPDMHIPPQVMRGLGLNDEAVAAMRTETWTAPEPTPDPMTVRVSAAVQVALAPVQDAVEASRDALQAFVDDPQPTNVEAALQAVAAVSLALAPASTETPGP